LIKKYSDLGELGVSVVKKGLNTIRKRDESRKGAKGAKFGKQENFPSRSWRLGARKFIEVVLSNISRN
jgi:hypothetical protein